jgi:hypothetical protein
LSEEGSAAPLKELSATSFGYIIGFLLPGLFGLYALGLWLSDVQTLLKPALSTQATVGPSFFLLLSALTMGLLLSAVRFFCFEKLLCRAHKFDKEIFKKLGTGEKLTAFNAVVEQHYRYHQFYGGCAIAALIAFPRWLQSVWSTISSLHGVMLVGGFLLLEILMIITARDSFTRYIERGNNIVRGESGESDV